METKKAIDKQVRFFNRLKELSGIYHDQMSYTGEGQAETLESYIRTEPIRPATDAPMSLRFIKEAGPPPTIQAMLWVTFFEYFPDGYFNGRLPDLEIDKDAKDLLRRLLPRHFF